MADTTEESGACLAALWVCRKRQLIEGWRRHNCIVLTSHPAFAGHTLRILRLHSADTTSNADNVSDPCSPCLTSSFSSLSSPQDASLLRLPRAYARHVQAGLQGCEPLILHCVLSDSRMFPQSMAPSSCRPTSPTTALVTSSTSRRMPLSKRACPTSTTTGK